MIGIDPTAAHSGNVRTSPAEGRLHSAILNVRLQDTERRLHATVSRVPLADSEEQIVL